MKLFEYQKRDERNETVTQHKTDDPLLFPVRMWAAIVHSILGYPCTDRESPVCTFHQNGTTSVISGPTILADLRAAVSALGRDFLGFNTEADVGLQFLHSGAAMAMYLGSVPVFTIMLIGRWSSNAFLRYIRCQVQQFSTGVPAKIIQQPSFFTIQESLAGPEDPRLQNHSHNLACRSQTGRVTHSAPVPPRFALYTQAAYILLGHEFPPQFRTSCSLEFTNQGFHSRAEARCKPSPIFHVTPIYFILLHIGLSN
jgi:hypothetical protein